MIEFNLPDHLIFWAKRNNFTFLSPNKHINIFIKNESNYQTITTTECMGIF